MPHFLRAALCASVVVAGAAHAADDAHPQGTRAHHPGHASPPSLLPPTARRASQARAYGGKPVDVLTYHYDKGRTGWNQTETDLTPSSVASSKFGLLQTLTVDGNVFAEPLLVSGYTMPDGSTHDVLIIATGHNSVYAYDAQSYALLWQVSLGKSQNSLDVGCADIIPEDGISATPVIVRRGSHAVIYVVGATEPSKNKFQTDLHALDLGTGADITPPAPISPSATLSDGTPLVFKPKQQYVRASLAAANGSIYLGISSHCDVDKQGISGWLLRYGAADLKLRAQFHTIDQPSKDGLELASIWMTGFAPAIDDMGHLFLATGNGGVTHGGRDWGESVLDLPPNLATVPNRFTPATYRMLNATDTDFGSGGVVLLPPVQGQTAPPMAVAIGKDATLYLLDQAHLGGRTADDSGALQSLRIAKSGNGTWGGPAYYDGDQTGPMIYVQTDGSVLHAYSLSAGSSPKLTHAADGTTTAGYGGSLPIVSSNGAANGTGVVWLIRRSTPMALEAYDAATLGAPIFSANTEEWPNPEHNSFLTPMQANGRVYVPGYNAVSVFGLAQ